MLKTTDGDVPGSATHTAHSRHKQPIGTQQLASLAGQQRKARRATSPRLMFSPPALLLPFLHAVEKCGHIASNHRFVWSKRVIGESRADSLAAQPGDVLGVRRISAHIDELGAECGRGQASCHTVQERCHIASRDGGIRLEAPIGESRRYARFCKP